MNTASHASNERKLPKLFHNNVFTTSNGSEFVSAQTKEVAAAPVYQVHVCSQVKQLDRNMLDIFDERKTLF